MSSENTEPGSSTPEISTELRNFVSRVIDIYKRSLNKLENRDLIILSIPLSRIIIGRNPYSGITIQDIRISKEHIAVTHLEKRTFVEDLQSSNGTLINGRRIDPSHLVEIKQGDILSLAAFKDNAVGEYNFIVGYPESSSNRNLNLYLIDSETANIIFVAKRLNNVDTDGLIKKILNGIRTASLTLE